MRWGVFLFLLACGFAAGASPSWAQLTSRSPGKVPVTVCPPQPEPDRRFSEIALAYPQDSLERRDEGIVVLAFTVKADGIVDPDSVKVTESSGFKALDSAAVRSVTERRFKAACRDGIGVDATVTDRVRFSIDSPPIANPYRPGRQPPYPATSVRLGEQGAVTVNFVVGADGYVKADTISITESGGPRFDAAVRSVLPSWYFEPARQGGVAVEQTHKQRIVFELRGASAPSSGSSSELSVSP